MSGAKAVFLFLVVCFVITTANLFWIVLQDPFSSWMRVDCRGVDGILLVKARGALGDEVDLKKEDLCERLRVPKR